MKIKAKVLGDETRAKIKDGIDEVANFVKITLGPKGRNVAFKQFGPLPTRVVNDGVTIAKEIKSQNPFKQAGIEMVQEICEKTNNLAGDGTTQTALLAQSIINEGNKRLVSGYNPMDIKAEIEEDGKNLLVELSGLANKIETLDEIEHLATISGNNDEEIGGAVREVMDKVGFNASVLIEKGFSDEKIRTETIKGIYFDKGYRAPAFINTYDKGTAEYKNPNIFLVDDDLRWDDDIAGFFQKYFDKSNTNLRPLVIIANEIDGEALFSMAVSNKAKYNPQQAQEFSDVCILPIESPFIGPDRKDFLDDLAIYIGGKVIGKDNGLKLSEVNPSDVAGTCERIVVTSKNTTIIGGAGQPNEVSKKIAEVKSLISQLDPNEKTIKEKLEKRRDTLESGVGVIYAGGSTEIEIKDRTLRLEDAVRASKSAIQEGYVVGGGLTYLKLSKLAKTDILRKALAMVTYQVAYNAGQVPEQVVEKCLATCDHDVGYNAKNGEYEDLRVAGVIDSALVLKCALRNAISLASLFLTTEGAIIEYNLPLKDEKLER